NDQGSCRANGCFAGLGADLRAGFAAGAVRLPPRAERSGRRERQVQGLLDSGHREVVDADLSGYFDGIPHGELMKSAARRISDGQMLALIKRWLESYRWKRSTSAGISGERLATGTPSGARPRAGCFRRYWRTSTCVVSCWVGRYEDTSGVSTRTLSTTLTTS